MLDFFRRGERATDRQCARIGQPGWVRLRPVDLVWNRAAMEAGGEQARRGDKALAALLRCHGEVMSGGMYFAIRDALSPGEVAAGVEGFRRFGLITAADVFQQAITASDDDLEALEEMYATAVPTDQVLVDAFEALYSAEPDDFAPLPSA